MKVLWFLFLLTIPFQLGRHFWLSFSYVNGIRVDYLAPTLYLSDLFFIALLIGYLVPRIKIIVSSPVCFLHSLFSGKRVGPAPWLIFSLAFIVFIASNIVFSMSPWLSLYNGFRLTQFVVLIVLARREKEKIIVVLKTVIPISATIQLCLSFAQIWFGHSVGGVFYWLGERTFNLATPDIAKAYLFHHVWLRPYGTFSHPNSLAGFALLVIVFAWYYLSAKNRRYTLTCSLFLVILSYSQSAWLSLLIFVCLYFWKRIGVVLRRRSIVYLGVLPVLVLVSCFLCYSSNFFSMPTVSLRITLIQASWYLFRHHLFFGVGLGNFVIALNQVNDYSRLVHWYQPVHNIFLLWISETGLVGLLALVLSALLFLRVNRSYCSVYSPLFAVIFITSMTGTFDHYWLTLVQNRLLLAIMLGLNYHVMIKKPNTMSTIGKNTPAFNRGK